MKCFYASPPSIYINSGKFFQELINVIITCILDVKDYKLKLLLNFSLRLAQLPYKY